MKSFRFSFLFFLVFLLSASAQIALNPTILGGGKTLFEGLKNKLTLKLTKSRAFRNGNVFLCYEPAA